MRKFSSRKWCAVSNSITIAFFSERGGEVSPVIYLRYGDYDIKGTLDDAMPRLITANPLASAAQFVACYVEWERGSTSVEIYNISDSTNDAEWAEKLASARRAADALVDVDKWALYLDGSETALRGERAKTTADLDREDRWPRFWASIIVTLQSFFGRRS